MKEQLAKMTIIELVRTAHSYSTSIKQTGVYSELVREMASRLEALNLAHIGSMYALEAAEKRIAELEDLLFSEVRLWKQRYDAANGRREAAEKRIAELEARTITVKLPDSLMPAQHGSGELFMSPDDVEQGGYLNRDDVLRALRKSGIKLQIEGE